MKALILTGGFGTRLRPLTYTRPKHLLPIANVPHVEHVFDLLQRHGTDEAVLLTSYLAEAFDEIVGRAEGRGMKLEVRHEPEPLGTAGALKNAQDLVTDETFFAFNGDVLTDVDLTSVADFHRSRGAEASLLLTPVDDPSAYGVVPTDPDGRVLGFIEKPTRDQAPTNLINAGVYVLEPRVLDRIPEGEVYSAERELFPAIVSDATMYALRSEAYWMDIGTPEKLLQANVDALEGRYLCDAVAEPAPGLNLSAPGAEIDATARVSSVCVGAGARIEANSVVDRAVLLPGAIVGHGATVRNTTLGEGARVMPGAVLEGAAIGDNDVVAPGN
ncbi:MAG: sugar phosphate nucleotidyltransferase [Actinomycetota bacterium]